MNRITRGTKSKEERLNELVEKLKAEQYKDPLGFNTQMADLSIRIINLKRAMGVHTPDEKHQLIEMMLFYAYHMKTAKSDRYVAQNTFTQILKLDPNNPEANYRYAFLQYEDGNWIKAINHFQQAIRCNNSDISLTDDQIIKANLFIGYCSIMQAKESMAAAEGLAGESVETPPGEISIDELTLKLKNELDSRELLLSTNTGTKLISKKEYKNLETLIGCNEVLLDLTTDKPFIQSGLNSWDISSQNAILFKMLLLKSANNKALYLTDITGYNEEMVANELDITWENYRQKIRRIKQLLVKVGLSEKLIENIPRRNGYKISNINFYIVQYDAK